MAGIQVEGRAGDDEPRSRSCGGRRRPGHRSADRHRWPSSETRSRRGSSRDRRGSRRSGRARRRCRRGAARRSAAPRAGSRNGARPPRRRHPDRLEDLASGSSGSWIRIDPPPISVPSSHEVIAATAPGPGIAVEVAGRERRTDGGAGRSAARSSFHPNIGKSVIQTRSCPSTGSATSRRSSPSTRAAISAVVGHDQERRRPRPPERGRRRRSSPRRSGTSRSALRQPSASTTAHTRPFAPSDLRLLGQLVEPLRRGNSPRAVQKPRTTPPSPIAPEKTLNSDASEDIAEIRRSPCRSAGRADPLP